nr:hypothetical protein [Morchella crassipes]
MRKKGSRQPPPPPQTLFSLNSGKIWAVVRGWLARERGALENPKAAPLPLGHPSWTPPLLHFIPPPPSHHRPSLSLNIFLLIFIYVIIITKNMREREGGPGEGGGYSEGGFKRSSKSSPPTTIIQHPLCQA